jgi:hypothetical protein
VQILHTRDCVDTVVRVMRLQNKKKKEKRNLNEEIDKNKESTTRIRRETHKKKKRERKCSSERGTQKWRRQKKRGHG